MEISQSSTVGQVGDLRVGTVVLNVRDIRAAQEFWERALGYVPRGDNSDPTSFLTLVPSSGSGTAISLQVSDAPPHSPAAVHLDLYTAEQRHHVERLVALGATVAEDWAYPPDPDFVVLRDPDGNDFCVIDEQP